MCNHIEIQTFLIECLEFVNRNPSCGFDAATSSKADTHRKCIRVVTDENEDFLANYRRGCASIESKTDTRIARRTVETSSNDNQSMLRIESCHRLMKMSSG